MVKESNRQRRSEIGRRAKAARESLPSELSKLQNFSRELGVSESSLSQMESGSRPIPAEHLRGISELTGVPYIQLLGENEDSRHFSTPYGPALQFLGQAEELGVAGLHNDRDAALYDLIPFVRTMYSGDICITASSSKGLQQDSNHDFVRAVVEVCETRPHVAVKIIFTHPKDGYRRELLEGRTKGSIVTEIYQGIRWAIERLRVIPENIRLIKASPTLFTVFASDGKEGIGLLNSYPHMKQAFPSFTFTVRSLQPQATLPPSRSKAVFNAMFVSNFQAPWFAGEEITVDLKKALHECKQEPDDELLSREATALESFLKEYENKRPVERDQQPESDDAKEPRRSKKYSTKG